MQRLNKLVSFVPNAVRRINPGSRNTGRRVFGCFSPLSKKSKKEDRCWYFAITLRRRCYAFIYSFPDPCHICRFYHPLNPPLLLLPPIHEDGVSRSQPPSEPTPYLATTSSYSNVWGISPLPIYLFFFRPFSSPSPTPPSPFN